MLVLSRGCCSLYFTSSGHETDQELEKIDQAPAVDWMMCERHQRRRVPTEHIGCTATNGHGCFEDLCTDDQCSGVEKGGSGRRGKEIRRQEADTGMQNSRDTTVGCACTRSVRSLNTSTYQTRLKTMAMTQDNIRALDQLRQRLSQLSTSISSLRADLERNEPLPTW